jgi:hypothetical protein
MLTSPTILTLWIWTQLLDNQEPAVMALVCTYQAENERNRNREQIEYIASILAMGSTSGAVRRIRCEPVESRP